MGVCHHIAVCGDDDAAALGFGSGFLLVGIAHHADDGLGNAVEGVFGVIALVGLCVGGLLVEGKSGVVFLYLVRIVALLVFLDRRGGRRHRDQTFAVRHGELRDREAVAVLLFAALLLILTVQKEEAEDTGKTAGKQHAEHDDDDDQALVALLLWRLWRLIAGRDLTRLPLVGIKIRGRLLRRLRGLLRLVAIALRRLLRRLRLLDKRAVLIDGGVLHRVVAVRRIIRLWVLRRIDRLLRLLRIDRLRRLLPCRLFLLHERLFRLEARYGLHRHLRLVLFGKRTLGLVAVETVIKLIIHINHLFP